MKHEWPIVEEEAGSKQWIFNKVVHYYRKTKKRCGDPGGACYYRKGDLRCFGGVLIDDDCYDASMEGTGAQILIASGYDLPEWFVENINLITKVTIYPRH